MLALVRRPLFVALSLILAACDVENSSMNSTGSGQGGSAAGGESILPGVNVDYDVTISYGDAEATCIAQYYQGSSPVFGTSINFSAGESVSVNGVSMQEQAAAGVFYGATIPLVDPDQPYVFALTVPGKGTTATSVDMVASATLTAPKSGTAVPEDEDLIVTWSNASARATDTIQVDYQANGTGTSGTTSVPAPPGATQATVSSATLQSIYAMAAGAAGGDVACTLTLQRSTEAAPPAPFTGGMIQLSDEVARISFALTPLALLPSVRVGSISWSRAPCA